jgi:hypothetical protein
MRLEEVFLNDLAQSNLLDVDRPPMRIDITGVGQPTAPEEVGPAPDDLTAIATQMSAGTEPEGATPMSLSEFATTMADVPAGLLKGAVQGTIGLPGDIESIAYGVREIFNRGADQGALEAFLTGLEQKTVLPTTENVKTWLDTNVGPLVPAGASERRREAAKIPEFVGELGAMGELATRATRGAARAAGQIGREIATKPPTGAVRFATPEQPKYFTQIPETSKEIDRITEYLERQSKDSGFQVKAGASNISGSRYVTVTKELPDDEVYSVQIRISNHGDKYPGSLGFASERFSIDPETGNTLQDALEFLKDQGFDLRKTKKRNKKLSEDDLATKYGNPDEQFLKSFRESRQSREQK